MAELKLSSAERSRRTMTKTTTKRIQKMYKQVYKDNKKALDALKGINTPAAGLERMRLEQLTRSLEDAYTQVGQAVQNEIRYGTQYVAKATCIDYTDKILKRVGLPVSGAYANVPWRVVDAIFTGSLYNRQYSLSRHIWADVSKNARDINAIVAKGIANNSSTYEIAKDLEKYVNPSAKKPWDWSKVYPGSTKTIDYNAQRLARTMITHAYQKSIVDLNEKNPFVEYFRWDASGSRPCPLCEERNGQLFPKDELPLDHPNGMCTFYIDIDLVSCGERLGAWASGESDPDIDEWMISIYHDDTRDIKGQFGRK